MRRVMLLALVVALAACGGDSTRRVSSGGLSLEIPSSWRIVDPQSLLEHAVTFAADARTMGDYSESFDATIRSIRLTN